MNLLLLLQRLFEDCFVTEIFQIARLCNCAWFAAVVFSDYFSAILGLVRQGSSWSLEPFGEIRADHELFERGRGNACSIEVRELLFSYYCKANKLSIVQLFVQVARYYFP